eukprot:scaffold3531_cov279-Prasinococcus_capsulatus_cf.AAC.8
MLSGGRAGACTAIGGRHAPARKLRAKPGWCLPRWTPQAGPWTACPTCCAGHPECGWAWCT